MAPREQGRAGMAVLLAVLLALVAGLAAWWQFTRTTTAREREPLPSAEAVARALAKAEVDSLALKTKWVDSVPEIDGAALQPDRHETFLRFVNARSCECGCGYTLGACRNFDPTCEFSGPLVAVLLDSIDAGHRFDLNGIRPRPGASGN